MGSYSIFIKKCFVFSLLFYIKEFIKIKNELKHQVEINK